jgi:hypothetical protein
VVKLGASHASRMEMPLFVAEQRVSGGEPLLDWVKDQLG